ICLCLISVVGYPLIHGLTVTGFQPWYSIEISGTYCLLLLAVLLQCELYGIHYKKVLLLTAPCALGLLCAILRSSGAAFWSPAVGAAFSFLSVCLKYYAAACLMGLSFQALWVGKRYSAPLMAASVFLSVCLVFDRLLPMYEPIYGGWFGELGGIMLTASLGGALWFDALDAYRFRLAYAEGYSRMEQRLSMQKEHYHQLSEQIQHAKEAAHDLRHHMRTMRGIVSEGNLEHLTAYLDSYEPHLTAREITVWSDHPTADAVIGHYATEAKELEVNYDVRLAIPSDLPFPDDELCILLGNLLENAMEALKRQKEAPRELYLRCDFNHGRLGLILDNSFDGILKERDGKYISTKHGGFGLGVSSVRAITEKYGGLADFSAEEHTFHASVMIPIVETTNADSKC
ncbi:MAG: ATP-binding protein, partial [Oscillospiraceae bacterium]